MFRSPRTHVVVSLPALAAAVLLAGCGSSLDSSEGGSGETSAAVKIGLLVPTSGCMRRWARICARVFSSTSISTAASSAVTRST